MWLLQSDLPWEQPLAAHIDQVCDAVGERHDELSALRQEGYLMDVFCFVEVESEQGGILIDSSTLQRLAYLSVELDLDIYASTDEAQLVAGERSG